jgi:hypothetical protein
MNPPATPAILAALLSLLACAAGAKTIRHDHQPSLRAPFFAADVTLDGQLSEPCYRDFVPVESFWVACEPDRKPPRTRAWLFWNDERLLCAFDCEDAGLVAAPKSASESDVDGQDRVELFLWSGRGHDAYYCVEIGALGALHDYRAQFYRQFDSAWALEGLRYAVARTATGYSVEAELPRAAMERMGFRLKPGARLRGGLFRGDFSASDPKAEPAWITWADARGAKPDFHVAASFGELALAREGAAPAESTFQITETDTQIKLVSPTLEATINRRGYVTGIAAGSFLDTRTGFRDAGYGLDIVDWIMEPGSDALYRHLLKGDLPYDFNNAYHGKRAKRSVEGPQICTQAKQLDPWVIRGPDYVAVKMRYQYHLAAPGKATGSIWDQTLLFPAGKRYFISRDKITSVNASDAMFFRLDMPGHIKHQRGDTFSEVYLSCHGRIPAREFFGDFPPDEKFHYLRGANPLPRRFIRAYHLRDPKTGRDGPWLAGMTLDSSAVYEGWCHQRGYVCLIEEIGGRPIRPGQSFGAAFIVGYFDSLEEMHRIYDRYAGHDDLEVDSAGWRLVKRRQ